MGEISSMDADVICLQEHWFDNRAVKMYKDWAKAHGYRYEALQRTAWNCTGNTEDGVAILVRERALDITDRFDVCFQDYDIPQDRVALLLMLQSVSRAENGDSAARNLAVLCTHLTYPHSRYDVESRRQQMEVCLEALQQRVPTGS